MSKVSYKFLKWWKKALGKEEIDRDVFGKRYFVINTILVGFLLVATANTILSFYYSIARGEEFTGASPFWPLMVTVVTMVFYVFFRNGYIKLASYYLFGVFWIVAIGESLAAGIHNSMSLLLYAWLITLTAILFSARRVVVANILIFASIFIVIWMQIKQYIHPYTGWETVDFDLANGIAYSFALLIIAIISWLYNREIYRSLQEANDSRRELKKERDMLDIRVQQRTEELKKTQMEQIDQLSKFVEYGKNMAGLLHDLVNPVAAISMNLTHVTDDSQNKTKMSDVKEYTKRALSAANKIQSFIETNKGKFKQNQSHQKIYIVRELDGIIQWFDYELKKNQIKIVNNIKADVWVYGEMSRFDQVASNLISNAIEAFDFDCPSDLTKKIEISAINNEQKTEIIFKDNGKGISIKDQKKIFQPFFTTKSRGTGIGMTITQKIMKECFNGEIFLESQPRKGTKITLLFPKIKSYANVKSKKID